MKSHSTYVKVRYAETDQMGVVHHGNYPQYLELARIDWLDALGISYKKMEEEGVMLPVYEFKIRFKKSAKFDDVLRIETVLVRKPSFRIEFSYKIFNEQNDLLSTAETTLVFLHRDTNKPVKCPDEILKKLGFH